MIKLAKEHEDTSHFVAALAAALQARSFITLSSTSTSSGLLPVVTANSAFMHCLHIQFEVCVDDCYLEHSRLLAKNVCGCTLFDMRGLLLYANVPHHSFLHSGTMLVFAYCSACGFRTQLPSMQAVAPTCFACAPSK